MCYEEESPGLCDLDQVWFPPTVADPVRPSLSVSPCPLSMQVWKKSTNRGTIDHADLNMKLGSHMAHINLFFTNLLLTHICFLLVFLSSRIKQKTRDNAGKKTMNTAECHLLKLCLIVH